MKAKNGLSCILIVCLSLFSGVALSQNERWVELTAYDKLEKSNDTHLINLKTGKCLTAFNAEKYPKTIQYNKIWLSGCKNTLAEDVQLGYFFEKYELDWGYANKHLRSAGLQTWNKRVDGNGTYLESFIYTLIGGGRIKHGDLLPNEWKNVDGFRNFHASINHIYDYTGLAYNTNYEFRNAYYCLATSENNLITEGDYWGDDGQPLVEHGAYVIFSGNCAHKHRGRQYWQFGDIALPPAPTPEGLDKLVSASQWHKCITYLNKNESEPNERFVMVECHSGLNHRQLLEVDDIYYKVRYGTFGNQTSSCLTVNKPDNQVKPGSCNKHKKQNFSEEWYTSPSTEGDYFRIRSKANGKCLTVKEDKVSGFMVVNYMEVRDCEDDNQNQQWEWKRECKMKMKPDLNKYLGKLTPGYDKCIASLGCRDRYEMSEYKDCN